MYIITFNPHSNPLGKQYYPYLANEKTRLREVKGINQSWDLVPPLSCP